MPQTQRLTTQEAADFLGISRPTLVRLLDQEKIPSDQPGRHRRIMFSDLLHYVEQRCEERMAALDRMTEDASSAGIYGGRPEDYAAALGEAQAAIEEIRPGIDVQKRFTDMREAFDDALVTGGKSSKPGSSCPTTMTATLSPQPSGRTPRPS